jgi:hypothetical protein
VTSDWGARTSLLRKLRYLDQNQGPCAFPYGARRAIRYGDGWIPTARGDVTDVLPKFREMAKPAAIPGGATSLLGTGAGDRIASTRGLRAGRSAEGTGSEADGSAGCGFGVNSASAAWRALVIRSRS